MTSQPISLAQRTWGDGTRCALLIHGLSSSAAGWWRVGPDLATCGFSVVAPDLRAHGETGQLERLDDRIDGYVADILALGSGWDVVLGHSLGGRIALEAQLVDPEFAKVLILEDPALYLPADPDVIEALASEYATELTVEAFRERYPRWSDQDIAAKVESLQQSSPEVVTRTVAALTDANHWPKLSGVPVPILIMGVTPEAGGFVPHELGTKVAEQANVTYIGIDDVGHSIHRDDYDAFWETLVTYLRSTGLMEG